MIEGLKSGASTFFQPGNFARSDTSGSSKVKLDLGSVPESKVKVQSVGNAGPGKGLKLDIKA